MNHVIIKYSPPTHDLDVNSFDITAEQLRGFSQFLTERQQPYGFRAFHLNEGKINKHGKLMHPYALVQLESKGEDIRPLTPSEIQSLVTEYCKRCKPRPPQTLKHFSVVGMYSTAEASDSAFREQLAFENSIRVERRLEDLFGEGKRLLARIGEAAARNY